MGAQLQHRAPALGAADGHACEPLHTNRPGRPADASALLDERTGEDRISRRVAPNGGISVAWQEISCGKHRGGRRVDVHLQGRVMQIWEGDELIKTVLRTNRQGGQEEARRAGGLNVAG